MKKILSLAMAVTLTAVAAGSVGAVAFAVGTPAAQAEETAAVYLVPGEGHALTGLEKADAASLNMEGDVYKAGAVGSTLPTPTTEQTDAEGNAFVFQGWWYIVDATVTYTETVPEVTETTYLYADFRAALSQHRDPEPPAEAESVALGDHIHIEHTDTGEVEDIPLRVSGTDFSTAEQAGHGHAVQWFNEYFELRPGDHVQFWMTGVQAKTPQCAPITTWDPSGFNKAGYEFATSGQNKTGDWLYPYNYNPERGPGGSNAFQYVKEPTFEYIGKEAHYFRIYLKIFDGGGWLNIYLEKKA